MTDERKFGKVKHWNSNSAYGFLAEDGGGQHFFHIRDVVTPGVAHLPVGQRVEFALGTNRRPDLGRALGAYMRTGARRRNDGRQQRRVVK